MENLMVQVIQQMKNTDIDDSPKEISIPLKKCVPASSSGQKNESVHTRSLRTSSFTILRDNVLQYVEDGGWNFQTLQSTTGAPTNSQESTRKTVCRPGQDISSLKRNSVTVCSPKSSGQQPPLLKSSVTQSLSDALHLLPLSQSCAHDAKHESGKCSNHRSRFHADSDPPRHYKDYWNKNFTETDNHADDVLSSPTNSSDYLTSLESMYGGAEKLSPVKSTSASDNNSISSHSVEGRTENISANGAHFTDSDDDSLQAVNTNLSESDGLSTYTLHNRWQEILPKEVIQKISRDNDTSKGHLLHHVNKENILTASTQYFTDSQSGLSDGDTDSIVLNNEGNSEFCWSTGSISVEGSVDDTDSSFNIEDYVIVTRTSPSISDSGNSCDSVDKPSQNSSSIQDAYRSILKTITNVDGTISPYFIRKGRRSRKAKKKPITQPVYICPKCQSKYFVSSKKVMAISKCLKCELWTSVNNTETEEEEEDEVPVSFCCLA